MNRFLSLALSTLLALGAAIALPSCGHDQVLTSITVAPNGASIDGTGAIVSFQATGTYIHPPQQKDLTGSVVWVSTAPQVIAFGFEGSTAGQAITLNACGTNIIVTATQYSNPQNQSGSVVIGTATISVTQKLLGC